VASPGFGVKGARTEMLRLKRRERDVLSQVGAGQG